MLHGIPHSETYISITAGWLDAASSPWHTHAYIISVALVTTQALEIPIEKPCFKLYNLIFLRTITMINCQGTFISCVMMEVHLFIMMALVPVNWNGPHLYGKRTTHPCVRVQGPEAVGWSDWEFRFWSEADVGSNPGSTISFSCIISGKYYLLEL